MAVRPVDIVSMQRMADVSQIKQNENNKPMNDQVNYDAKEKGKNEYQHDGKVKMKKKDGHESVMPDDPDFKGLFDVSV